MIIFPRVLFVTNKEDLAVDYLIYKAKNKKIQYLRLNSEDIIECTLTFNLDGIIVKYDDYEYRLDNLHSIYLRRAPSVFPSCQEIEDTNFINSERRDFLEGIYLSLNCKWVNPLFTTYKSERKLYQLSIVFLASRNVSNGN